jgi:amino acid adenylation domain-containing protein
VQETFSPSNAELSLANASEAKRNLLQKYLRGELDADATSSRAIARRTPEAAPQLSFAQERLWFLDQLMPGSPVFNVPLAVRVSKPLDLEVLQNSLCEIVRRHEAFRTTFITVDGRPAAVISPDPKIQLRVIDLDAVSASLREADCRRLVAEEALRPFDLAHGPLIRTSLIKLEAQQSLFLLTMHHIVSDGWSIVLFFQELSALYQAFSNGKPSPLVEPSIQYSDYAAWQRDWLRGEVLEQQLSYWKKQLGGELPVLELPADHPRPPVQTYPGARATLMLSREKTDALIAFSRSEGATPFMTMLAAFKVLLHRYTGQDDVIVGSPMTNRPQAETEKLIGFFLNNLALRTDLSGDPSFLQLLARVREMALDAYANQDVPFEKLIAQLKPQRDLSRSAVFQVYFNLFSFSKEIELPDGEKISFVDAWLQSEEYLSKFDLTLYAGIKGGELNLSFVYNTDLFEEASIQRMLAHFRSLLESVVANPGLAISEYALTDESEVSISRQEVRPRNTFVGFERAEIEQSINARFEAQVRQYPARVAVKTRHHQWSYEKLNARAKQIAHSIVSLCGAGEQRVALLCEHDAPMIAAMLGALQAGKTYVPMDPNYPEERLTYILEHSESTTLLVDGKNLALARRLTKSRLNVINIEHVDSGDAVVDLPEVKPDALAYILYTSGSSGHPKGVMQNHRNVLHFIRAYTNNLHLHADDRLTLLSSYCFDASVMDIYGALLNGATLYPVDIRQDGLAGLSEQMRSEGITIYHSTPTVYRYFIETLTQQSEFPRLRLVVLGGEEVKWRDVELYRKHFSDECLFVNGLGPTESTVSLQNFIDKQSCLAGEGVPVGFPVADTEVLLLNDAGKPVEIKGEIAIKSPHVALGYWRNPEATNAAFSNTSTVPEDDAGVPLASHAQDAPATDSVRIYRTGDLGRRLADGSIQFEGRKDFQIKLRGYRVELGEIEAVLSQHPSVRDSVVVIREISDHDKQLVAYVVPHSNQLDENDLRSFLKGKLPEYMLPAAFVTLDSLPLTASGKVNRRDLPTPDCVARPNEFLAPRTQAEELLSGVWAEVLKIARVGATDNFFDLGGHSLLATQVVSRLRDVFQVEIPLRTLFEYPTVEGLADYVEANRRPGQDLSTPPILPVSEPNCSPLSFAQERMWFLERLDPNRSLYNLCRAIRLRGTIDIQALRQALAAIVTRHEALRTNFVFDNGEPRQLISAPPACNLSQVDLSCEPEPEREPLARRWLEEEARRPFDLTRDPLFQATLIRLNEAEHILVLTVHHIVFDGWSAGILSAELAAGYKSFVCGETPSLTDLPVQYADYARWQRRWLSGEVLESQLAYWKQQLAGAPARLTLPTDRPQPAVQTFNGAREFLTLSPRIAERLKELSQRESATQFMTLLAAFVTLLSRYTGQEDIVVGSPIAGRTRTETEQLIGLFVNTLVLRTAVSGDLSFSELLRRVSRMTLEAYAHQDVPFEKVVEELQPERNPGSHPLFQVMFVLRNGLPPALELPGVQSEFVEIDHCTSNFDLTLEIIENADELMCAVEYNSNLFDAATIVHLLGHFETLLEGVVADPELKISELPLIPESELRRILVEWNDTRTDYPANKCVHELFEERARSAPEATALVFNDSRLTYRELNRQANQLANYLRGLGVGPDVLVGVRMERSARLVVALLGIVKAGGAYLPLDLSYPKERVAFMLSDARAPVLLTQQHLVGGLPESDTKLVSVDAKWEVIARESAENPINLSMAENLLYVIYTSGSTGTPKGVSVTHRAVNRLVLNTDYVELTAADRVAQASNSSFDAATFEIWGALLHGAQLVGISQDVLLAPKRFAEEIRTRKISVMFLTTALFNQIARDAPAAFNSMRQLMFGGEAVDPHSVRRVIQHGPPQRLVHVYGPTESTTFSTWYLIESVPDNALTIPIGRPISNTETYIVDQYLNPVPVGVPGDLYIGGDGLARDYLNRPELTSERFIANPFSDSPRARLYRTGDVARYRADGNIEFVGRVDHQVKIRGFRVELGEVEAALTEYPEVAEAVVTIKEDQPGDKRLTAYFVPVKESKITVAKLRELLKQRLPDYMIPAAFVRLESLPLSPNGKVDRRALPGPEGVKPDLETDFVAPSDELELKLTKIWEKVLDVRPVGVNDNFFELGGHSLLAMRVFVRIENSFGRNLPLATLFQAPTVRKLAQVLRQEGWNAPWSSVVAIQPQGSKPPFFCVHAAGGNVLEFVDLAHHLGTEQPFYGLQSQGLDKTQPLHTSINEMARHYLKEMREVQPAGPYFIGGRSLGGTIAFEMACQLRAQGEEVGLLALLDTYPAGYTKLLPAKAHSETTNGRGGSRLERHFANLRRLTVADKVLYVIDKARYAPHKMKSFVWRRIYRLFRDLNLELPPLLRDVMEFNSMAGREYVPQVYDGKVTLFWASGDLRAYEVVNGWDVLAVGGTEILEIPGTHLDIIKEPHVAELALKLTESLARAQGRDLRVTEIGNLQSERLGWNEFNPREPRAAGIAGH